MKKEQQAIIGVQMKGPIWNFLVCYQLWQVFEEGQKVQYLNSNTASYPPHHKKQSCNENISFMNHTFYFALII